MEDIASMALEIGKCLKEEEKANKFASKWLSEVQALNLKTGSSLLLLRRNLGNPHAGCRQ